MKAESSGSKAWLRATTALCFLIAIIALIVYLDPDNAYLWIKALHVMAIIAWMAGLLYLPRLFIYHHETAAGSEASNLFKTMEGRLFGIIMTPAMFVAWAMGLFIAWNIYGFQGGWLHAKIGLAVIMTAMHVYLGKSLREFRDDGRPGTTRHWRIMNEVPALLMVCIVILAIVKPF